MPAKSIATLLLLWLASLCHVPLSAAQINVAVVVNSGNAVSTLSLGDLRKIFSGEKHSWPRGQPIKLVVRGPGVQERLLLLKLLPSSQAQTNHIVTATNVICAP